MSLFPELYSVYVVPRFLHLHTVVYTESRGTFSCLKIAIKEELETVGPISFLRNWLCLDFPIVSRAKKALVLKVNKTVNLVYLNI